MYDIWTSNGFSAYCTCDGARILLHCVGPHCHYFAGEVDFPILIVVGRDPAVVTLFLPGMDVLISATDLRGVAG